MSMKNLVCVCIIFFLSITGCSREPQKPKEPSVSAKGEVAQEKQKSKELSPAGKEIADKNENGDSAHLCLRLFSDPLS